MADVIARELLEEGVAPEVARYGCYTIQVPKGEAIFGQLSDDSRDKWFGTSRGGISRSFDYVGDLMAFYAKEQKRKATSGS